MASRTNIICAYPNCTNRLWSHHVRAGYKLCGFHQCCEEGTIHTDLPAAVPAHFNQGLGVWIEDRDHLKRVRERMKADGTISNWD